MNSFGACAATLILSCMWLITNLSGIMGIHVHFDHVCVCASMYDLGFAYGVCADYVM